MGNKEKVPHWGLFVLNQQKSLCIFPPQSNGICEQDRCSKELMFYTPDHLRELAAASTSFSQSPRLILIKMRGKVGLMETWLRRGCVLAVSEHREET